MICILASLREVLKLVEELDPPGRFLRKNGTGAFVEVSKREAREKVCQTMRDAVSEANTPRRSSVTNKSSDEEDCGKSSSDEESDEEDEKMPPLPVIKQESVDSVPSEFVSYSGFTPDRVTSRRNAPRRSSVTNKSEDDDKSSSDEESDEEDEKMPPFPVIKQEPVDSFPSEVVSYSGFTPDRVTSSRLCIPTVTPTDNAIVPTPAVAAATSTQRTNEASPPLIFSETEMTYDAYNYLSRVGTYDDFDLFDGELLNSDDEVFAPLQG